jgi:hypothetical protein
MPNVVAPTYYNRNIDRNDRKRSHNLKHHSRCVIYDRKMCIELSITTVFVFINAASLTIVTYDCHLQS